MREYYKINKGVPLVANSAGRKLGENMDIVSRMEVGDSFDIPKNVSKRTSIQKAGKRLGFTIVTRILTEDSETFYRIWRTA